MYICICGSVWQKTQCSYTDCILNVPICIKRAGHLSLNKALDLIGYLRFETHTVPLLQGLSYLELFYRIIERSNEFDLTRKLGVRRLLYYYGVYAIISMKCSSTLCEILLLCVLVQMYILRFFRTLIDQQTWTDRGSVSERRLRSEVLSLACHLDDPLCLEKAHQSFKDWLHSSGTIQYVCLNYILPHHIISHQLLVQDI